MVSLCPAVGTNGCGCVPLGGNVCVSWPTFMRELYRNVCGEQHPHHGGGETHSDVPTTYPCGARLSHVGEIAPEAEAAAPRCFALMVRSPVGRKFYLASNLGQESPRLFAIG